MKYVYIILTIVIVVQVIRRRFDFLSFAALTYIFYSINCAFGETWITGGRTGYYYNSGISLYTYIFVIVQMLLIILYLYKEWRGVVFTIGTRRLFYGQKGEQFGIEKKSFDHETNMFWNVLLIFCYIIFIYSIVFEIGLGNFFSYTHKSTLIENVSGFFSFGIWGSILCFLHGAKYGRKKQVFLSFLLIVCTLLLGSRSYLATVLVGFIALKSGNVKSILKENVKVILLGAVLVIFLLFYKNIYASIRAFDFKSALAIILSGDSAVTSLSDIAEFRTVFSIYDYVVSTGFHLPLADSIARIVSIIPLANNLIPTRYPIRLATIAKEQFFSSSYGVGSSFWGETIAMGGIFFLAIVTLVWLIGMKKASGHIASNKDSSIFVLTVASYCAFYIHRLDWIQVFGCMKSVVILYILWYVWNNVRNRYVR